MSSDASDVRFREVFRRLDGLEKSVNNGTFVRKDVHGVEHVGISEDIAEIKLILKEDKAAKDQDRRLMKGVMYTALASLAVGIALALISAVIVISSRGAVG